MSIVQNTCKYANKNSVIKAVEKKKRVTGNDWRAVLVDSFCQAGKNKKCFEILASKMNKNTLGSVLFITQANSTASANQIIQRAINSDILKHAIKAENICRSKDAPTDGVAHEGDNVMIVDFWTSRNMSNMLDYVPINRSVFDEIIDVVDEAEQAGHKGLQERLSFIRSFEKYALASLIKVIFVTATVANLSKSILQIAKTNLVNFQSGVVHEIVNESVVERYFAEPHETFVGASWFKETPGVWKRVVFPQKVADQSKINMETVKALPDSAKELSLIVTSTLTSEHRSVADRLNRIGYNVTVELNGKNNKNFTISFIDKSGGISTWDLPYHQIDTEPDQGDMETFRSSGKKIVKSGIEQKEDYTMSHIASEAQRQLHQMSEQGLSNSLWALATLCGDQHSHSAFIQALVREVEGRLSNFKPQNLSNSLWALATLCGDQHNHSAFIQALVRKAEDRLSNFKPQNLSNSLWALAKLGHTDCSFTARLLQAARAQLPVFNAQAVSNTALALGTLRYQDTNFMRQLVQHAGSRLPDFKAQEVANTLWAMAWLCYNDAAFADNAVRQLLQHNDSFNTQGLCNTFWALCILDHSPAAVLQLLIAEAQS